MVFTGLMMIFVVIIGIELERTTIIVPGIGFVISLFEVFYVQGRSGRWLRAMHPAKSIVVYSLLIVVFAMSVMMVVSALSGPFFGAEMMSERPDAMPSMLISLPVMFAISVTAIMTLRIVGYLGGKNLIQMTIGKYHRPVLERRIFLFLDIKGSTALVERLGPIETRAFIGKFFFDISGKVTDHGGEIYRFTGDGVVAVWVWKQGIVKNRIVRAIDAIGNVVDHEADSYRSRFGHVPEYRIGVHGGPIIICEEGDTRRAIGFYGDTIHIAARLEQKAKELGIDCVLSGNIAEHQVGLGERLRLIGDEPVRGISAPIKIYQLRRVG
jgi:class 3 adenylate cyclase